MFRKPPTIRIHDFINTPVGKEFAKRVSNIVSELGDRPCKGTALRYLCAYGADEFLRNLIPEEDGFNNYELDERILSATIDDLMAAFDTWLDSEYCSSIIGPDPDSARLERVSILSPWSIDEEYGIPWSDVENIGTVD